MTTHSQRALILYRRRRFINHLLTYLLNTSTTLQNSVARFVSDSWASCCFCQNFVEFPLTLKGFGVYMAKWLKLYAVHTFSTKLDPLNYSTLLNSDFLNFYLTPDVLQSDCSDLVSKWRGQTVTTTFFARSHCQTCAFSQDEFFMCQQDGAPAHREHDTVAFLERERDARRVVVYKSVCQCERGIFRAPILTILSRSVMITNNSNKPYFSVLCPNSVVI